MISHCPHCGGQIGSSKIERPFAPKEIQRFWKSVEKRDNGCWIYTRGNQTYGRIIMGGVSQGAHIASWKIHGGKIPQGKILLHGCDTPRCVNPAHLSVGTHAENAADRSRKGRNNTLTGTKNPLSKLDEEKVLYIRESIANETETLNSLAEKYGMSFQGVYHVARGQVWKSVGGPLLPAIHTQRLSSEIVLKIRSEPRFHGQTVLLAKKYGVSQTHISKILTGNAWKT